VDKLSGHFLEELYKSCLRSKDILEICINHLKYEYLPTEEYKKIWKLISNSYEVNGTLSSVGTLGQVFVNDADTLQLIGKIKHAEIVEKDLLISNLEDFLKQSMLKTRISEDADGNGGFAKVWEKSKEEGYKLIHKLSEDLQAFSLKREYYEKIFDNFEKRSLERKSNMDSHKISNEKLPFGIEEIDFLIEGGINVTDTALFLGGSGSGKTKLLRHIGVTAARLGKKVLHLQAEGSKEETLRGYDSTWTGLSNHDIDFCKIDSKLSEKLNKIVRDLKAGGGEIYVHAFEQFGTATMADARNILIEVEKNHGKIDLVLFDYLELFDPSNGIKYKPQDERFRRLAVGNKMKNLAVEGVTRVVAVTQASSVNEELLNDAKYKMTRYNVSECKGIVQPFSYFITINQTRDEQNEQIIRLFCDKFRFNKSGQTVRICTNFKKDRFFDRAKTRLHFFDPLKGEEPD